MDPLTLLAASVGTTAVGAISAQRSASTASKQSKIDAAASAEKLRRQQARQIGQTRAAFGASGVQLTGTPLLVLQDQAAEAEENRRLVIHGGDIQARRAKAQGRQALFQAGGNILGSVASFQAAKG